MNCWFVSKRFTCCCCGTNELAVFAITHLEGFVFKRSPKPVKVQLLQCCLQLSWGVLFGLFETAQQRSNTSTFKVRSCSFSTRCSSGFHCLELKASLGVYIFSSLGSASKPTDETLQIQVSTSDTALVYSAQLLGSTGRGRSPEVVYILGWWKLEWLGCVSFWSNQPLSEVSFGLK